MDQGDTIDAVICNAGIGGWTGLNWPLTIWLVLTDLVHAVTFPPFKVSGVGWTCKPQFEIKSVDGQKKEADGQEDKDEELGEVFMANVFGHYMLAHWLAPLLGSSSHGGRVIWLSSMEAYAKTLNLDDFQGLKSSMVYEQTKRMTDLMVLTSELPSTKPFVSSYLSPSSDNENPFTDGTPSPASSYDDTDQVLLDAQLGVVPKEPPKFYLSQPGICATSIIALPLILEYLMAGVFYFARLLGSPWHTCSAYKGSVAPVWLALRPADELEMLESSPSETGSGVASRKGKWGSAVSRWGQERVARTETEGWGWAGQVGEGTEWRSGFMPRKDGKRGSGRWRYACDLTSEGRERFEEEGRNVWKEMERLRRYWEGRLATYEKSTG